jgi:hypothetical protein
MIRLTQHAQHRMKFRGIREEDIEQALWFGRHHRNGTRTVYVLDKGATDYPGALPSRLDGLVVVRSQDDVVVTAYRRSQRNIGSRI